MPLDIGITRPLDMDQLKDHNQRASSRKRRIKKWSLEATLKAIVDVLAGKVDRNGVCDADRRPRVPLPEYVFYFYTERTQGTLAEAKECTAKLVNAAKEHSKNLMATAFLQITGIYSRELYTARHAEYIPSHPSAPYL